MAFLTQQALNFLEPLGFAWVCLVLLTAALFWRRHWRFGLGALVPVSVLYLFGSTDLSGFLMRSLERPYAGVNLAALPAADAVVVLGGGAQPARFEVADLHLTPAGDRIIMGLEMTRLGKAPVLVIGGAAAKFPEGRKSESQTVRKWIVERQFTTAEVVPLPVCGNTRDEAVFVKNIANERGWQRVLLVTSANHMRRAAATFRTAGVDVIPVPCNFMTELSHAPSENLLPGIPRAGGLAKMATYLHEQIGWVVYRRRGWIAGE